MKWDSVLITDDQRRIATDLLLLREEMKHMMHLVTNFSGFSLFVTLSSSFAMTRWQAFRKHA